MYMSIFKPIELLRVHLDEVSIQAGQLLYCIDTLENFLDTSDTTRIQITDTIYLDTEEVKDSMIVALPNKLYIIKETQKMYTYEAGEGWIGLSVGPQGEQGIQGIQGNKGDTGYAGQYLNIVKVYNSLALLLADISPTGINDGECAVISSQDANNNKVYMWTNGVYDYVDLTGDGIIVGSTVVGTKGDSGTIIIDKTNTVAAGTPASVVNVGSTTDAHLVFNIPIGPTGAQGIQGVQGEKGETGSNGSVGAIGVQGIQGIKGDKGDTGATGPQGITGAQGQTGASGMNWRGGYTNGANYNTDDVVYYEGSSYFCTLSNNGKLPTDTAYWQPLSIEGSTGPQGEQGIQGIKGDKGDTGLTGAVGPQGPIGLTGATGAQGIQGIQGETGAIGATGATGPIGLTGAGVAGPIGPTGATGPVGPQGLQGVDVGSIDGGNARSTYATYQHIDGGGAAG